MLESTLITISLQDGPREDLHSLYAWLSPGVDGRVSLRTRPPAAGELGAAMEALMVTLAPGGVIGALIGAVAAWLSSRRTGEVTVRITGSGGRSVELTARQVRGLRPAELHRLVQQVSDTLGAEPDRPAALHAGDVETH